MADTTSARAEILRSKDFIGWSVTDKAGKKVGTVADVLFDRRGSIRFLDVNFGIFRKHVLIPPEVLDWGADSLLLERWTQDEVKGLPPYDPDQPLSGELLGELERAHPRYYGRGPDPLSAPGEPRALPLSDARDVKLPKGAPDLRKWSVFGADGERVGTVSEMLVDAAAMRVRYLDVDLADDLFLLSDDRHVLIPLEHVELKERGEDVWVQGLSAAEVAKLPAYTGGGVAPGMADVVDGAFRPGVEVRDDEVVEPEEGE
ncbi:hypothetical protein BH23GEM4_BH23GEM4_12600 [soil metagenome]